MMAILQDQPDDSSFDELLTELRFAQMIERGLPDAEVGRIISSNEMKRRLDSCPIDQ